MRTFFPTKTKNPKKKKRVPPPWRVGVFWWTVAIGMKREEFDIFRILRHSKGVPLCFACTFVLPHAANYFPHTASPTGAAGLRPLRLLRPLHRPSIAHSHAPWQPSALVPGKTSRGGEGGESSTAQDTTLKL